MHADPERAGLVDNQPRHAPFEHEFRGVGGIITDKADAIEAQHAAKDRADPQIPLRRLSHVRDRPFGQPLIRAPHLDHIILGG